MKELFAALICEKFIYVKSAYKQPLDRELCVCDQDDTGSLCTVIM